MMKKREFLTKTDIKGIDLFRRVWNTYFILGWLGVILASMFGSRTGFPLYGKVLLVFFIGIFLIYGGFLMKYHYNIIRDQWGPWTISQEDIDTTIPKSDFDYILGLIFLIIGILSILVGACVLFGPCG
jgi:uncharacterized membrane protein HdeD (DUF308 family)